MFSTVTPGFLSVGTVLLVIVVVIGYFVIRSGGWRLK